MPFPFEGIYMTSPYIRLDYHLVPTAILYQMHPRGFPHQHSTSSSFLQKKFQNAVLTSVGQPHKKVHLSQYLHSRQATLHVTCITIQVLSYHNKSKDYFYNKSPQTLGSIIVCHYGRPISSSSASTPNWA